MLEIYGERFADADGRVRATFEIVWLSGWAPHESQQQPLRPGSAQHAAGGCAGNEGTVGGREGERAVRTSPRFMLSVGTLVQQSRWSGCRGCRRSRRRRRRCRPRSARIRSRSRRPVARHAPAQHRDAIAAGSSHRPARLRISGHRAFRFGFRLLTAASSGARSAERPQAASDSPSAGSDAPRRASGPPAA